ncbi:MAG: nuclear transport factor 2 family protein [Pseudomonadales bacterium]
MPKIDPHRSWLALEARAAEEANPRCRALLLKVRDHMRHEILGEIEPLMATLTASPVYHFWGGTPSVLQGAEAVRGFYQAMFERGGQQFEVVVERIVVDETAVITEGQVKIVRRGAELRAAGVDQVAGEPLADGDLVLTTAQLITVWPADADGRLVGEDIYFGEDPLARAEKIQPADLPSYYRL